VRAAFHALVAALFTVPMWIIVGRFTFLFPGTGFPTTSLFDPSEPIPRQTIWLIAISNAIIWGVPLVVVVYRWRQQIVHHPERTRSSLVRTYAYSQAAAIALALPVLCWFGLMLKWMFFP